MSTIQVEVLRNGIAITQKDRPVRRLKDGRFGVVYQGRVYPLQRNRAIELSGTWFPPASCPVLREVPASLASIPAEVSPPRLHLDVSGFYKYVMVQGSEEDLRAALGACEAADLEVLASGRSSRPSDDGQQYDWYIRIDAEGADSIATTLGIRSATPQRQDRPENVEEPSRPSSLSTRLEALTEALGEAEAALRHSLEAREIESKQVSVLQRSLQQAKQREDFLEQQLVEVKSALSSDVDNATTSLVAVSSAKSALEARLMTVEEEQSHLRLLLADAESLGQQYSLDAAAASSRVDELTVSLEDAEVRNEELRLKVDTLMSREIQTTRSAQFFRDRFSCLLEHLLPNICLLRDSFDQIFNDAEISDLRGPLTMLHRLQSDGAIEGKRFKNDWFEAGHGKFKPTFRLYYRKQGDSCRIYLSPKSRQVQDEGWLQRNS